MNNNNGFTLVELIVAIVLLSIVAGITTYSISNIIKRNNEENYNLLLKNIDSAAETYYQECNYSWSEIVDMIGSEAEANIFCDYDVLLGELVEFGYLQGNSKKNNETYTIVNPLDSSDISGCEVHVEYTAGEVKTSFNNNLCPKNE